MPRHVTQTSSFFFFEELYGIINLWVLLFHLRQEGPVVASAERPRGGGAAALLEVVLRQVHSGVPILRCVRLLIRLIHLLRRSFEFVLPLSLMIILPIFWQTWQKSRTKPKGLGQQASMGISNERLVINAHGALSCHAIVKTISDSADAMPSAFLRVLIQVFHWMTVFFHELGLKLFSSGTRQ
jgi:hypothetical protein